MYQFIYQIYKITDASSKKTVFLDRDGTINQEVNYLSRIEQINFLPTVIDGIKKLNQNDFVVIIVTNQAVIAKGLATVRDVEKINNSLVGLLNRERAYINAIYSCPHHPNADVKKYRVVCECRKPRLAMFKQAIEDFDIDLKSSYMIGDSMRDIIAGENIGIPTLLVETGYGGYDNVCPVIPDYHCSNFSDAVDIIIST